MECLNGKLLKYTPLKQSMVANGRITASECIRCSKSNPKNCIRNLNHGRALRSSSFVIDRNVFNPALNTSTHKIKSELAGNASTGDSRLVF